MQQLALSRHPRCYFKTCSKNDRLLQNKYSPVCALVSYKGLCQPRRMCPVDPTLIAPLSVFCASGNQLCESGHPGQNIEPNRCPVPASSHLRDGPSQNASRQQSAIHLVIRQHVHTGVYLL